MPRLLIVEDNEVNRRMLCRRLAPKGYDMVEAGTGEEGLAIAFADPPDAVLMDLGLPGIDGWEATRRLRADPRTARVPVVALSAHAHPADREKALAAGCADFETKPVNLPVLLSKLEAVLKKPEGDDDDIFAGLGRATASPGAVTGVLGYVNRPGPAPAGGPDHDACPVLRKRVLVVEDHDANRAVLARKLNKLGHQTVEAADGTRALEQLRAAGPFDLVLLDVMMPGLSGEEVLLEIKRDPRLASTPVIMVSALDEAATVARCIEAGAEDYLPKPYDPVLLRARVNACLDKRRLRDRDLANLAALAVLTKAAESVEAGRFNPDDLSPVANRADELGQLARVFLRMADEVAVRERALRDEVNRLQVAVDGGRAAEQVAAVTENEYFQDLQERAAGLRARSRRPRPEGGG